MKTTKVYFVEMPKSFELQTENGTFLNRINKFYLINEKKEKLKPSQAKAMFNKDYPESEGYQMWDRDYETSKELKDKLNKKDITDVIEERKVDDVKTVIQAPVSFAEAEGDGKEAVTDYQKQHPEVVEAFVEVPEPITDHDKKEQIEAEAEAEHFSQEAEELQNEIIKIKQQLKTEKMKPKTETKTMIKVNKLGRILATGVDWIAKATLITPEVGFQVIENTGRTGKMALIHAEVGISRVLKTNYYRDPDTGVMYPVSKEDALKGAEERVQKIASFPIDAPLALGRKIKQAVQAKRVEVPAQATA